MAENPALNKHGACSLPCIRRKMAFLVPTLLGYIDKTKKQMIINEARDVWGASQAALTECYGLHPESFEASCKFTSSIGGRTVKNLGRISNGALGALQKDPGDTVEAGTSSRRIARHPGNNKRSDGSTENNSPVLPLRMFVPIGFGRTTHNFFKFANKITDIFKSAIQCDIKHWIVCRFKQNTCLLNAVIKQILNRRNTCNILEKTAEILAVARDGICQVLQSDRLVIIMLHIRDDRLIVLYFLLVCLCVCILD